MILFMPSSKQYLIIFIPRLTPNKAPILSEKQTMNTTARILLMLTVLTLSLAACTTRRASSPKFMDNQVIAHRGAWKTQGLPQNSIAALHEAIRLG